MREIIENMEGKLEENRLSIRAMDIDDDIIEAAREYFASTNKLSKIVQELSRHIKKKTGKPVGMPHISMLLGRWASMDGL